MQERTQERTQTEQQKRKRGRPKRSEIQAEQKKKFEAQETKQVETPEKTTSPKYVKVEKNLILQNRNYW